MKQVFKIKSVGNNVLRDFAGMNYYAGKAMHFHPLPHKNEILVDKTYKGAKRRQLIKHEEEEAHLMKNGMGYFQAHKLALDIEHKHNPHWMHSVILVGDKVSKNMLQPKVYVCKFNRNHKFTNYEDYVYHMNNVETSRP